MAKRKGSMKGIRLARCVLEGMREGHSKAKARRSCGVKAKR